MLSLRNVTAAPAAVAGAAGRGGAGRSGGGFPGAAARCQRSAPGGGGGVQRGQQELRGPGRAAGRAAGRAGPGEPGSVEVDSCQNLMVVILDFQVRGRFR